jgi:hypothetical protein
MRIDSGGVLNVSMTGEEAGTVNGFQLLSPAGSGGLTVYSSAAARDQITLKNSVTAGTTSGSTCAIGVSSGDLYVKTAGAERLRIDESGKVGIGTTSPEMKLDVLGTTRLIGDVDIYSSTGGAVNSSFQYLGSAALPRAAAIYSKTDTATAGNLVLATAQTGTGTITERLRINSSGVLNVSMTGTETGAVNGFQLLSPAGSGGLTIYSSAAARDQIQLKNSVSAGTTSGSTCAIGVSSGDLYVKTADTERMRISSTGNVGIGTTGAGASLDVQSATDGLVAVLRSPNLSTDTTGKTKLGFHFRGHGAAGIAGVKQTANTTALDFYTEFGFNTEVEKMRILANGNVGIGMTNPTAQLEVFTDSAKKPSTNTWTITSDERLKTNITTADNDRCYEIVKQVALKRYTWKGEVYSQDQVKDRSKLGWIAQDVESVFPKAVGTSRFAYNQVFEDVVTPELDSDGNAVLDENGVAKTKTEKRLVSEDVIEDCRDLNADQMYAAMYGAIQKLIEKVEFLESKVATLEAA